MAKALAAIDSTGLKNTRLHFDDASNLMKWLPDGSLARIELIHPDPWPKRRHWKRRFVQDPTIAQFARLLRRGGEIRFVTDVSDYAAWTLQRFLRSADFEWTAQCADDWRQPWPAFGGTRYHSKAARQERRALFFDLPAALAPGRGPLQPPGKPLYFAHPLWIPHSVRLIRTILRVGPPGPALFYYLSAGKFRAGLRVHNGS